MNCIRGHIEISLFRISADVKSQSLLPLKQNHVFQLPLLKKKRLGTSVPTQYIQYIKIILELVPLKFFSHHFWIKFPCFQVNDIFIFH